MFADHRRVVELGMQAKHDAARSRELVTWWLVLPLLAVRFAASTRRAPLPQVGEGEQHSGRLRQ